MNIQENGVLINFGRILKSSVDVVRCSQNDAIEHNDFDYYISELKSKSEILSMKYFGWTLFIVDMVNFNVPDNSKHKYLLAFDKN